jgi:hypothetical protein
MCAIFRVWVVGMLRAPALDMRSYSKSITLFLFASFMLLSAAGGCSHINEATDCDQMCKNLKTCIDGDLDVSDCSERCEDKVHDSPLADELDACTDCLDRDYSCGEVADECSACDEVTMALL